MKPILQIENSDSENIILMKNGIKKKISFYIIKSLSSNNSNVEDIINDAKLFISNNYMKDISIDMINEPLLVFAHFKEIVGYEYTISGNLISENEGNGILANYWSDNNDFIGNDIKFNEKFGISEKRTARIIVSI